MLMRSCTGRAGDADRGWSAIAKRSCCGRACVGQRSCAARRSGATDEQVLLVLGCETLRVMPRRAPIRTCTPGPQSRRPSTGRGQGEARGRGGAHASSRQLAVSSRQRRRSAAPRAHGRGGAARAQGAGRRRRTEQLDSPGGGMVAPRSASPPKPPAGTYEAAGELSRRDATPKGGNCFWRGGRDRENNKNQ